LFFLDFFYYFGWSHSLRSPIKGRNKQLMGSHKMEISARPSHLLISCFFFFRFCCFIRDGWFVFPPPWSSR
jgi:hypothetical protein